MRILRLTGAVTAVLLATSMLATPARAAEPFGYTGVVRNEVGDPIQGACLALHRDATTVQAEFCTDADGRYTITGVPTDVTYKVRIHAPGYRTQWWFRDPDYLNGEIVWVPASALVEQDFTLGVGAGTIRGRITDEQGAAADATVGVHPLDYPGDFIAYTWDLGDGRYEIGNLAPGRYQVSIGDNRRGIQWAPQQESREDAGVFTVTDGGTVVVDEQWLPLGTVEVTVLNADTGAPVAEPCLWLDGISDSACGTDGLIRKTDVRPGYWRYSVTAGASYFPTEDERYVEVRRGQTARLTVRLAPAGAVVTKVVDAQTGQPVASICVHLVLPYAGGQSAHMTQTCSDDQGVLAIGPFTETAKYQLYAWQSRNPFRPPAVLYGTQWVTADGGSGDQRQALTVTIKPKQTITIPQIKVDRPGTIAGVIRDAVTGAPISSVCAFPYAFNPGQGYTSGRHCSNAAGQYRIEDLGPYDWPVEFAPVANSGYAWQWSGNVADRFDASLTRVAAGQTATVDASLVRGGSLAGVVTNGATPADSGQVWAFNARTGDVASDAYANIGRDGTFSLPGHRTQQVYVRYFVGASGCWYGPAPAWALRPARAVPVTVTAGATATVAMDMGRTCAPPPRP